MVLGSISLPGVTRSAPDAREFVVKVAHVQVDAEVLGDIALCVSELIANACEHTASGRGGRVAVYVEAEPAAIRVTVVDDGGSVARPHVAEALGENGRGLQLVEALSLGWGVEETTDGTAVWVEFPTGRPVPA